MPKKYDNQYSHNKLFLGDLNENFPEDYFDWKVTAQFYTGLHKCYCVLLAKAVVVNASHQMNISSLKIIDSDLSRSLFKLLKNSKNSRYDGFLTEEAMVRMNKIMFSEGSVLLKQIENDSLKYYPVSVKSETA